MTCRSGTCEVAGQGAYPLYMARRDVGALLKYLSSEIEIFKKESKAATAIVLQGRIDELAEKMEISARVMRTKAETMRAGADIVKERQRGYRENRRGRDADQREGGQSPACSGADGPPTVGGRA